MNDLDQLLAEAAFQTTFKKQKELLDTEFRDACVMAHSGGIFDLTPEFLAGVQFRNSYSTENKLWVVDRNQNCVLINDVDAFLSQAAELYNQAAKHYGAEWNVLRSKQRMRSTKSLIQ